MVLPEGGESTWGWPQNSMITVNPQSGRVTYQPEYHLMRHFSAFVRPGAVRLETCGAWSGNALAFENPDGTQVVVAANPYRSEHELVVNLRGETVALRLAPGSINTLRG